MGLSVIGSIFNITGIAVNRYCYICHSFSYSRLYNYRNTLLFVALIWVLTVVAIIPNFFVGSLRYDPRVYSCTFAQNVSSSYTVAVVVVHFLVPIAVVTFCYLRIWVLVIQVGLSAPGTLLMSLQQDSRITAQPISSRKAPEHPWGQTAKLLISWPLSIEPLLSSNVTIYRQNT